MSEGTSSRISPIETDRSGHSSRATSPTGSPGTAIDLLVNGEPLRVTSPCTVTGVLESLELGGKRVAVALNREVVIRSRYGDVEVGAGDRIEILEAVGGG
jgi:sulfur carrier protein